MMALRADLSNQIFNLKIKNLKNANRRGIRQAFFRLGKDLVKDSKQLIIKGPKTGRLYRIKGRSRRHRASAPGEAPANLTGALQKSLDFKIKGADSLEFGSNPNKFGGLTEATANYAKVLEEGNRRIKKRPFIRPTVKKNNRRAQKHFEAELRKANS